MVLLPSGKRIELAYFSSGGGARERTPELHRCPACASELVHPTSWTQSPDGEWELHLRCPNCDWAGEARPDHDTIERLEDELDRGTRRLLSDLQQLTQTHMEEDVERFIAALEADAIQPMDF